MRVRQSVTVTKPKHARTGEVGTIEKLIGADAQGQNPKKVEVKFDTPDPDGEIIEFAAADVTLLPGTK